MWLWVFMGAIVCGIAGAIVTSARGAEAATGALLGFFLGPLGVIASFAFGGAGAKEQRAITRGEMRKCPSCAEHIKAEAVKCRYCGTELEPMHKVAEVQDRVKTPDEIYAESEDAGQVIGYLILATAIILIGMTIFMMKG